MTVHEYLADYFPWFWVHFANHLWQSTLFLLAIMVANVLFSRSTARSRFSVWLLASAKFVFPLSMFAALGTWLDLTTIIPVSSIIDSQVVEGINLASIGLVSVANIETVQTTTAAASHSELYCVLTLLWIFGCLLLFALWWKRSQSFRRVLARETLPAKGIEMEFLKNARIRLGITRRVDLVNSYSVSAPVVWGILRPIVVVPYGLSQKLASDEFELILMHELSHVVRRDNLFGVLQMALSCLLWFHPLIWLVKRKLLEERERACDEAVVRFENGPQRYAASLLKVVRFGLESRQSAGLANAGGANLNKRMEIIMKGKNENSNSRWRQRTGVSIVVGLIVACIVGSFVMAQNKNDRLTDGSQNDAVKQVQDSTDVPFRIWGNPDCPLSITEAIGKEISGTMFTKLTNKVTKLAKVTSVPEVKMVNNSEKAIKGLVLVIRDPETRIQFTILHEMKTSIAPGSAYSVLREHFVNPHFFHPQAYSDLGRVERGHDYEPVSPKPDTEDYWIDFTDRANLVVTIGFVKFEDDTSWTLMSHENVK